jgi:WD40 repeat protein
LQQKKPAWKTGLFLVKNLSEPFWCNWKKALSIRTFSNGLLMVPGILLLFSLSSCSLGRVDNNGSTKVEQPTAEASPEPAFLHTPSPPAASDPTPDQESQPPPEAGSTPSPVIEPGTISSPAPPSPSPDTEPLEIDRENTYLLASMDFGAWDHILALDWSPDGEVLAASAGENVHLVSFPSLEALHKLPVGASTESLVFSKAPSDFLLLALAVKDGTIQLWDADVGELLCSFPGHRNGAKSISISDDGLTLATSGMDPMVRVWNLAAFLESGTCPVPLQAELIGGARTVPDAVIHPDGRFVASIDLRQIRLREIASQRIIGTIQVFETSYSAVIDPDGRWLAGGLAGDRIRVWEVDSLEAVAELAPVEPPQSSRVFTWSLAFHPSGKWLAAGSSTGLVRVWQLEVNKESKQVLLLDAHEKSAASLAFHPFENILVSGGLDGMLLYWSIDP